MVKALSSRSVVMMVAIVSVVTLFQSSTSARHSWRRFHWARTANPVVVNLGDNLSSNWTTYLNNASYDWTNKPTQFPYPDVLDAPVVPGGGGAGCTPTSGRVEVCNGAYGQNGWLGIAQIWVAGQHITQGITKLNDTYFNTAPYTDADWRQLVMCQEVGHTFGLGHQDEKFNNANLGSCMDYTNNPSTNTRPNAHDFEQLSIIYGHTDSFNSANAAPAFGGAQDLESPSQWGQLMRSSRGGRTQVFERDFGNGRRVVTFVIWA